MPTPSTDDLPQDPPLLDHYRSVHATCPPDDDRLPDTNTVSEPITGSASLSDNETLDDAPQVADGVTTAQTPIHDTYTPSATSSQSLDTATDDVVRDSPSPMSVLDDTKNDAAAQVASSLDPASPIAGASLPGTLKSAPFPQLRPLPKYTPSFLRHGSKFAGTQQSDRQVYNVQVEIKHVDMAESFICGYLRIEGLTADNPTLTTYFEGEIIGTKYTFQTRHAEWGSSEKVDMQHWNRFQAWKPLARAAGRRDFSYKNFADREHIFMRWKEYFLVPDHRVRTISGASFEGFYYICFNQLTGTVSGIYFHARSEKFQQLELTHVDDRGCLGAVEFR